MEKGELLFIKLGGSLITRKDSPFTINYGEIRRVVKEIKEGMEDKEEVKLLIGHGGGSFPHTIADLFDTSKGFIKENSKRGFVLCQNAASSLNRIIVDLMLDYGIPALSIQPSASCIATKGEIDDFFIKPIMACLEERIIPVVFGDCVIDTVKGCAIISTERILAYLSKHIKPSRVLIFTSVGGVYTSDPHKDKDARFIPEIKVKEFEARALEAKLEGSLVTDVTGGMREKVKELVKIAKMGVECEILSGKRGYIRRAIAGERGLGTIIRL
ncbi:MAG: isopentenyl phosphate kinase [Candidatus Methanospirareceae archaeon]